MGQKLAVAQFQPKRVALAALTGGAVAAALAGPATIAGASAGTRVALMVMHLLAAALISGALLRGAE